MNTSHSSEMYHEAGLATCHSCVDYSVTARLIEMWWLQALGTHLMIFLIRRWLCHVWSQYSIS